MVKTKRSKMNKAHITPCHACDLLKDPIRRGARLLYLSKHFGAFVVDEPLFRPHIDRKDGGHLAILPRRHMVDRSEFTREEAEEFILLSMAVGGAMYKALPSRRIKLAIINYQQNGNWSVDRHGGPHLHLHLYGRARDSKHQKHGEALYFPPKGDRFYNVFKPFNKNDESALKRALFSIMLDKKYALLKKRNLP
ncbi:hypothetical protein HZB03_04255 [Candidatus Woesearchaeota archaeon]|nr:hypothetical protein [Candidatus Woesearchaeota archaeon]